MFWAMVPGSTLAVTKRSHTGVHKLQVRMVVDLMMTLMVGDRAYKPLFNLLYVI
jgi:hypothetical protein